MNFFENIYFYGKLGEFITQKTEFMKMLFLNFILLLLFIEFSHCQSTEKSINHTVNKCPEQIKDIDGNIYKTIIIGSQCWMQSNLKVTKYRDKTVIPKVTDAGAWSKLNTGARCSYENVLSNSYIHGNLYNWFAISDNRKICPVGWRVPNDSDWKTLTNYLGGTDAGGKIKASGQKYWNNPNKGATNNSGFTALPSGRRNYDGSYSNIKYHSFFWTSSVGVIKTTAWNRNFYHDLSDVGRVDSDMNYGFSVRCIKE